MRPIFAQLPISLITGQRALTDQFLETLPCDRSDPQNAG